MKIYIAILAVLVFASCSKKNNKKERSDKQSHYIETLTDSVGPKSEKFLNLCDSFMAIATDSMDYYELKAMKGMHFQLTSQWDSLIHTAIATHNFAEQQEPSPRVNALKAMALMMEGNYYHTQRLENQKAISIYTKAYNKAMESSNQDMAPDIAANLADAYTFVDDMPKASQWYRRALVLADSLNLPNRKTITLYMGMARIYTQMFDYNAAETIYKKVEPHYGEMTINMQAYFLNNYGNLYYYKEDYQKALEIFRKLKRLIEEEMGENTFDMFFCKVNLADVMLNLNMTDSASFYLDQVEPVFKANNIEPCIYYANTIRIGIAIKEKKYNEIKKIIDSEHFTSEIEQNIEDIRSKYLEDYYINTGDWKSAYKSLSQRIEENDSLEHNKQKMHSSDILIKLREDTLRLHHQLEINAQNVKISHAKNAILTFTLICVIMASVLIYLVMYHKRKSIQSEMNILRLKLENSRLRISPHFIFNILNAQIGDNDDKNKTLVKLSRIIRNNLEMTTSPTVSIEDELDFVGRYIELQQTLFNNELKYNVYVDETLNTKEFKIPSMFVQILVENSIKHALKLKDGEKLLCINVRQNEESVMIEVVDNGQGFNVCMNDTSSTKTGLNIIRQSMAAINRKNDKRNRMQFSISNVKDENNEVKGCKATLTIPKCIKL